MRKCNHCRSDVDQYVLLYEKGNNQPAQIDLWAFHNGEHIRVGSITTIKVLKNMKLKPTFFCANCYAAIPRPFSNESHKNQLLVRKI